jgi:hypothetical protein
MDTLEKRLQSLNLRARLAYGINCILCYAHSKRIEIPITLVDTLKSFVKLRYVDDWLYQMTECIPSSVLEFSNYADDYEFLQEKDFYDIYNFYSNCNDTNLINMIDNNIFEAGTNDLYGQVNIHGASIIEILKIIQILKENKIRLPNVEKLEAYTLNEKAGISQYGLPITDKNIWLY